MITGKTISQLDLLSNITDDTSMPVELSGNTYHVQYSSITNNLIEQGFNSGIKLIGKKIGLNLNPTTTNTFIIIPNTCLNTIESGQTISSLNVFNQVTADIIGEVSVFEGNLYIPISNSTGISSLVTPLISMILLVV